jgi:hypothetical protein
MTKKDIRKQVWDRAFDNLDENGDPIIQSRKIKSDGKISLIESNKRKAKDPKFLQKMKTINIGKVRTEEHKNKLSQIHKGKKRSDEVVEKIRQGMVGKPSNNKGKGKPIITPDGEFATIKLAVEFYFSKWNLVIGTVENKIIRFLKDPSKTDWNYKTK